MCFKIFFMEILWMRAYRLIAVVLGVLLAIAVAGYVTLYSQRPPEHWQVLDDTGGCALFPPEAIFQQRIDSLPVHADSSRWIGSIGGAARLHADWGREEDPSKTAKFYGVPFTVASRSELPQPWPVVDFDVRDVRDQTSGAPSESDCAAPSAAADPRLQRDCTRLPRSQRRFPFPPDELIKAEGGLCNDPAQCGDRHVLVIESSVCRLWESYLAYKVNGRWQAYATAAWDLNSLQQRPDGWTSADAAGLPIVPLLARANEASSGEIRHALRVTFRDAVLDREHVWPARHGAGSTRKGGIPFGAVLRLRQDFNIPWWWNSQARTLAQAMQRYGVYVADIGQDFFVQGEPSARWSPLTKYQLRQLRLREFEFVDLSKVTAHPQFSENSYRASWPDTPSSKASSSAKSPP